MCIYPFGYFPIINYFKANEKYLNWAEKLIHFFKLDEFIDLHPLKLSYGQKKKLSIASVLSFQPRLLLLDEIFIGQSVEEIFFIMQQLTEYIKQFSATIILVNHQPEIVEKFANRTIILENGRIESNSISNGTSNIGYFTKNNPQNNQRPENVG